MLLGKQTCCIAAAQIAIHLAACLAVAQCFNQYIHSQLVTCYCVQHSNFCYLAGAPAWLATCQRACIMPDSVHVFLQVPPVPEVDAAQLLVCLLC
jgi:hypothetical protein